ncbi:hypothetical protein KKG15_00110, partial [Patescibacteria group bacterium]|nr:hypothetical protein [Patescibacteria group bacterium]
LNNTKEIEIWKVLQVFLCFALRSFSEGCGGKLSYVNSNTENQNGNTIRGRNNPTIASPSF